jgi:hypothetical protein
MDTKQDWKGLDGAIAWHLIERQAENWNQVGEMMNEWLKANTPTKEWVGLTDQDMNDPKTHNLDFILGARWAEEILKERNE